MTECPLCTQSNDIRGVSGPDHRHYLLCGHCHLIFTPARFHLPEHEERERYMKHHNGIDNPGYVSFLNKAIDPALEYISPGMEGLDYGCGPVPTLSELLKKQGISCENHDPMFFPELSPGKQYDFIFATECFEHFFRPARDIRQINGLLKAGGILVVMTELWQDVGRFVHWTYARDKTHVSFYHGRTLAFIAETYGWQMLFTDGERVFVFRRG